VEGLEVTSRHFVDSRPRVLTKSYLWGNLMSKIWKIYSYQNSNALGVGISGFHVNHRGHIGVRSANPLTGMLQRMSGQKMNVPR
jgi:hypothetical protein